jgi:hypothetical protein
MSKPLPAKYCTTNWKSYNAELKRRGSLMIWLDKDLAWQGQAKDKPAAVFQQCRHPVRPHHQVPVRLGPAPGDGFR